MRRDPFEQRKSLSQVAALEYFTDREGAIEAFERYLHAPAVSEGVQEGCVGARRLQHAQGTLGLIHCSSVATMRATIHAGVGHAPTCAPAPCLP